MKISATLPFGLALAMLLTALPYQNLQATVNETKSGIINVLSTEETGGGNY